ncbi:uncharacterized acetyltransferase At3g50280-like [Pistacia vera]|uniref:uncharacterized acetyltransferase At3g50280-like n=1 Tax=Pistacia vera TaxID=55513 RepID=UPI0012635C4F|nr:uncharacterized acetyltransferase At3g50280-like [Pistacia vera]
MANIRLISSSSVCAANHKKPNLRIDLTPWDLQLFLVDSIQKGLLFHKPKPPDNEELENTNFNSIINHLKTSLSRTLDFFPPLSGRFATTEHDDNTVSFFIDCNNAGAEFIHAVAEGVSIADIIEPIYVPKIVYSFFPLNGVRNHEGTSKPLLAVQVTELVDGIFIGCTINHTVADGSSFWHFFNSWSEISRGLNCLSKPPLLQRWFVRNTDCPVRIPLLTNEQLYNRFVPPLLQQRVFHFTRENIAKLKAKANAEIGTNKISSLQALLSHFWRSAIRNKHLDPNEEINYRMLIGARQRLQAQLQAEYFGNAVQTGTVAMKAGEVVEKGLGYVALQMNKMVAVHTEEKLMNFLKSWTDSPKLITMDSVVTNALVTSSSPRFNIYGNDFGWGKPIAVRSGPGNKFDGKITVFPGEEEGSVDIEACLSPETLQGMANDADLMEAVIN